MNTDFSGTDEARPMSEYATLPSARLASRPAALLLLAGNALQRRHALPDNSPAAHSTAFNGGF